MGQDAIVPAFALLLLSASRLQITQAVSFPPGQEKREVLLTDQGTKIQERSHALGTGTRPVSKKALFEH